MRKLCRWLLCNDFTSACCRVRLVGSGLTRGDVRSDAWGGWPFALLMHRLRVCQQQQSTCLSVDSLTLMIMKLEALLAGTALTRGDIVFFERRVIIADTVSDLPSCHVRTATLSHGHACTDLKRCSLFFK